MDFEFSKYLELIFCKELEQAVVYRKNNMPKILYKYISLSDEPTCKKDSLSCYRELELDEKKFNSLESNSIWMSKFEYLNDPFEYKAMFLDKEKLELKGWPLDVLNNYIDEMKKVYNIASFTTNLVDNMPMWAHYANNHKGYCVEYDVLGAKAVFPISYEINRSSIASIITNIFSKVVKIQKGKINELDKDYQFYMTLISHFGLIKHRTWDYENEFRVLYPQLRDEKPGILINSLKVGLQAKAIYVGNQCTCNNRKRLFNIAEKLGIAIYEMYLEESNLKFELSFKSLLLH